MSRDPLSDAAPLVELAGITVRFGDRDVVTDLDLDVAEHEIVCVLGPSGSGKSTLLRVLAGLQPTTAGTVRLAGADQAGVPAHKRGVGLMFQDHQLFPHRDVAGNVEFGMRMRGLGKAERGPRTEELLDLVGLPGAGARAVGSLSGGEQQRVALARALAPEPRLLMLDEPLGQLDRGLRERLVVELRELFTRLGTTVLAVTHDQGEAFALADRVVVMRDGRIAQSGPPAEVWSRPASEFVARFLGFDNVIAVEVAEGRAHGAWGPVPVAKDAAPGPAKLLVRPAGVRILPPDAETGTGEPALACTVAARTFRGSHVALTLTPDEGPALEAECELGAAPTAGDHLRVTFDRAETVLLPAED
ncbi:ABC transporter ATP-binding protein [Streptomyces sp. BI20]|uniref:ABC transporter ATP-binding protein n=1 Tax=Streptomyces sp. BI20 TaxID=3403460 RepID=UPI003C78894C